MMLTWFMPVAVIMMQPVVTQDPKPWAMSYESFRSRFHSARIASGWLADGIPKIGKHPKAWFGGEIELTPPTKYHINLFFKINSSNKGKPISLRIYTRNTGGPAWGDVEISTTAACAVVALGGAASVGKAEKLLEPLGVGTYTHPGREILIPGYRIYLPRNLELGERRALVIEAR